MLKISKYANKLNKFFQAYYSRQELHYVVSVQLNFAIEVSLYMEDSVSFSREQLKDDYKNWVMNAKASEEIEDVNFLGSQESCYIEECEEDFKVYFEEGAVKFYVNEFGSPGDPGEDGYNGIRWGSRYRLSSLLNRNNIKKNEDLPPVVTFYSYKGGMGRTTTMMGFALWLANKNKRVAIIDCDLEAPGYLNFFSLDKQRQFIEGNKNGFVEFMADYGFMKNIIEVSDYSVTPIAPNNNPEAGKIYDNIIIVPGGNLNDGFVIEKADEEDENRFEANYNNLAKRNRRDYIEGLSRLNLSNPSVLKNSFSALIQLLKNEYDVDIVLIDSRTGFNDIYGSTAFDLADKVVAFFGFSKQTSPGLRQLLDTYVEKRTDALGSNRLTLTLCNSILPSNAVLDSDADLRKKWNAYGYDFATQVKNICSNSVKNNYSGQDIEVPIPTVYPIHRRLELEELGMSGDADLDFLKMITQDSFEDYSNLFASIFNDLSALFPNLAQSRQTQEDKEQEIMSEKQNFSFESMEAIRHMRPLQLTKVILRELKSKLEKVANFAEQMDVQKKEMFLYRECMKEIFNPSKFIVRGYKGAGKTCIYQALGQTNEVTDFIRSRADVDSECDFVSVIDFQGISNHPLKLLEDDGVFAKDRFFNINAFWQILMWKAIFSKDEYNQLLSHSPIKEDFLKLNGLKSHKLLLAIQEMIEGGSSKVLASIEDDLERLEEYLAEKNRKLFIMYDGLDNVVKPKYWSKAISPLINKWGGNISAYNHIHSKIFLRTDLFERIEGTNVERLKENIIDIDWEIAEVFGYLFKLVLGSSDNPSREAMWTIIRKLRRDTAESMINNMTRAINNGLGQFPKLDGQALKPLVEIFFGREVNPKGAHLGNPWDYFEKQLSNAAGKISMRLFINTLTTDVIDKGLENSNPHVTEVISPDLYASREVRIKVADSYFNDMASEEDFTDDLQKVREFINSETGKDFRKKILSEAEFNELMNSIINVYRNDLRAVETPSELAQLIYASGIMKEIYKRGRKIYRFSPMYEYPWGLVGKSIDDDDEKPSSYSTKRQYSPQENDILEGTLRINPRGRYTVISEDGHPYECEGIPQGIPLNSKVRFMYIRRSKIGGGYYRMSTNIEAID